MEIRKATLNDYDAVLMLKLESKELERKFNKGLAPVSRVRQYYEKYLKEDLSSESSVVFIAVGGKKPIAMVVAEIYKRLPIYGQERRGHLRNLYVKEEFREQGIGTRLVEKAIEWLKSKNVKAATCEIYRENAPSLNLLHSLGFIDLSLKIFKEL